MFSIDNFVAFELSEAMDNGEDYRVIGMLYQAPSLVKRSIPTSVVDGPTEAELPKDFTLLSKCGRTVMVDVAKNYMRGRGFGEWYWDRYRLGLSEQYYGRIIIPIEAGYWQGRKYIDWLEPKYLNPEAPNRSILFNAQALYSGADEIVVCEGAFSAMAVNEDAIAIISKEPTVERIERMAQAPPTIYIIALEPGAYISMGKLMVALSRAGKEVVVWNYSVGDPADPVGKFEIIPFDFKARLRLGFV